MNHLNLGKRTFRLSDNFIEQYKKQKPPFGFNGLGELTYIRTYSRLKENGDNEQWFETIQRVVEGTYSIQKNHINYYQLGWDETQAQDSAQEMYDLMFNMKFLPPGRGLWAMGTDIIEKRGLFAALNNCAFISTDNLAKDLTKPFEFLMDMSMLGVGVGFDVVGAGQLEIKKPKDNVNEIVYQIEDSREGWVKSLKLILLGYFKGSIIPILDYSLIRVKGEPIKTFGGTSSGPDPLKHLHEQVNLILSNSIGKKISIRNIVDIMNLIGQCVVAGGVRRTAEISFGPSEDEYLSLKDYQWSDEHQKFIGSMSERASFGWTSNNSIFAELGQDYTYVGQQTSVNGEPGYAWLENMRDFSRMCDPADHKDRKVKGGNPCIIGSTLIAVADGRNAVPIKDLVGTKYPVYTIKDGKVVIGNSIKTWKTRENTEVWKLTLDDGSILIATPDHQIMLRNGKYKELKDLIKNDELMPFNSYLSSLDKTIQVTKDFQISVKRVEFYGYEDVYDMTVEDTHNFAIISHVNDTHKFTNTSGIFVHNCLEQSLESYELCCLVESFVNSCDSLEEFLRVLKYAYLYAKTVTLGQTHWAETNKVMLRNRRIGTSMSGIVQRINKIGIHSFKDWCTQGYQTIQKYDELYSDWLCVVKSIKTTSVKPSGTISLLRGATPGMHFPEDIYCIRRIRILKTSHLIEKCINAGYKVEPDVVDSSVMVVEIPIMFEDVDRTVDQVSIWEQVALAAFLQHYWADNQVSCTVTFKPELSKNEQLEFENLHANVMLGKRLDHSDQVKLLNLTTKHNSAEGKQIPNILNYYQYQLKGISFLPKLELGVYAQMPFESITKEKYDELSKNITQIDFSGIGEDSTPEKFCDGDHCVI